MKIRLLKRLICFLIIIGTFFGAVTVLASDSTEIPSGYVITDGTTFYWIQYDDLLSSYVQYRQDPNSQGALLAKFYFDTLGTDVSAHMAAYVSGVTVKFVSFEAIMDMYIDTRDVNSTYIWFNSSDPNDATPAFDVITEVMIMGPDANITGKVYVGTDGYIITLPSQGIIIPGIVRLTIDANQTDAYLNLYNPSDNECYFKISLKLDDGTVLYESGMLSPGETVGNINLSQALASGEYDAVVLYEAFDPDDYSPLNSAEVIITLIVE